MMLKVLIINALMLLLFKSTTFALWQPVAEPALQHDVDSVNKLAYNYRLKNPEQTIKYATTAFTLAKKINYLNGQGEACRVTGIGQSYISKYDEALDKYLEAISYFEQNNNFKGVGKVYNNIGNLYSANDYNKALEYYNKSLLIAKKFNAKPEIASLYVNIGIIQRKKKNFKAALEKFQISMKLFQQLGNQELIIQCLQSLGEVYNDLKQYQNAENVLNEAFIKAKARDMNFTIASIELTLTNLYLNQNKFEQAKEALKKGFEYTKTLNNRDLQNDYNYALYQLEYKRQNYREALNYLKKNFSQDSAYYRQSFSNRITLASDLFEQLENRRKNERTIAQQKYATTLFWSSTAVAALLFALVFLLVINVKRTNKNNKELTRLNKEVSRKKEDLDRVNQNLEDIIETRTQDLKVKNKRLSDYSLHLSHEIRGPIATLKGIVYIQENNLIDKDECIELIKKCVFNIDDEIINMSKMLNESVEPNPKK
ncbi:tetratricopeptide repeat protein [uncultured Mucilaginibacter sp.]|uniref:tetratricopeptide repeat protein n=1 Tax=uncultured Mucilaginibacter sp. TaxID=797541 RepID=UPI00261155FF|nr:tetratricopeptide repeat protein [uncultured Mucilaginibacter sp.]